MAEEREYGSLDVAELVGKLRDQGIDRDTVEEMFNEELDNYADDEPDGIVRPPKVRKKLASNRPIE